MQWSTETPKYSAYYFAVPKDRDTWLDCSIEVVYVYFDGKFSVARPGEGKHSRLDDFTHWWGPLDWPPPPEGLNADWERVDDA